MELEEHFQTCFLLDTKISNVIKQIEEHKGKEPGQPDIWTGRVPVASNPEGKHLRDDGHPQRHHEEDVGNTHLHFSSEITRD